MDIQDEARFAAERQRMVAEQLRARGIHDERILEAMANVPRHRFIVPWLRQDAYADSPVEIGEGQTVSQPYIVAAMLQLLSIEPDHSVLEVGTGTGYQAAVLGKLAARVHTIERHASLAEKACQNLRSLGMDNVVVHCGDGTLGLPAYAPFNRIIVAAAAPDIPETLFQQLTPDGRMILPVGGDTQYLNLVIRTGNERKVHILDACRFVPLIGEAGYAAWNPKEREP
jgi:protein-L-isoaspartate(D-aspartate) O-methyltransferase